MNNRDLNNNYSTGEHNKTEPLASHWKDDNLGKCLVIGGAGMLGYAIVDHLRAQNYDVRVLDLEPLDRSDVDSIVGDIRNIVDLERALEGIDVVFHTAAAVWNPQFPSSIYHDVNVQGTKNIIDCCIKKKVKKLVFTSTMDVVVQGKKPNIYTCESDCSYPDPLPDDEYSKSKILAEKEIIKANETNGLLTCSLRPVGIYGPKDKYHLPSIIKVARTKFNIKMGDGSAKFSHVYCENAAHAHILAAKHLNHGSPVAGECYFITDHQPAENLFAFMEPFLEELGLAKPKISIPYRLAYILAWISEKITPKSFFNRFAVIQTCVDHTFVSDKARKHFGYELIISKEEAFKKTLQWLKNYENFDEMIEKNVQNIKDY